tara:strand:+ start:168 stop:857 length:690 start_codon:yes stop_codon:yes gene_type:complete
MPTLILSCGRTGTNMLLEVMRGSTVLQATTEYAEHKYVFRQCAQLEPLYLSKCDTHYVDSARQVSNLMDKNPDLKILWTLRDLRDAAMSKLYRGYPKQIGHLPADDATFDGCIKDISWMVEVYEHLQENYSDRIMTVRMEDMVLNFDETVLAICEFVGIPFEESMRNFVDRYRNAEYAGYKEIDKSKYQMYKRKDTVYDGFFATTSFDFEIEKLFESLEPYQKRLGYLE